MDIYSDILDYFMGVCESLLRKGSLFESFSYNFSEDYGERSLTSLKDSSLSVENLWDVFWMSLSVIFSGFMMDDRGLSYGV